MLITRLFPLKRATAIGAVRRDLETTNLKSE